MVCKGKVRQGGGKSCKDVRDEMKCNTVGIYGTRTVRKRSAEVRECPYQDDESLRNNGTSK